jgi:8-oxo-dGTP diphosphatase
MITVCAGIIFNESDDKILIARRKSGHLKGFWEFPGGKLEKGETFQDCILREIEEELCVRSKIISFFHETIYSKGTKSIKLIFYKIKLVDTKICFNAHDMILWEKPSQFKNYKFPEADLEVIELLNSKK